MPRLLLIYINVAIDREIEDREFILLAVLFASHKLAEQTEEL